MIAEQRLFGFTQYTVDAIPWIDGIAIVAVVIVHALLGVVIQLVEENKVRVLALYSEVKVADAKEALIKCQRYMQYL